ncbi:unnamed protein product [Chrysodeixis includens]|uniref:Uncharacterized protein n=1 Tax=Chrysodeixis includens TaxID=689277 RepID=A0A9N8KVG2_CHRIL|nr:unnamed protein product [Chrysodeixis includens]
MNREPSPIELSAAAVRARSSAPQGPARARPAPVPAPAEVTLRPNMAARAQEVRSLPIGTSPSAGAATPAAVHRSEQGSARSPQPEPTRSCTREPLPRCGETDEGRPRRRRRRLRRTRTPPPVPFRGCAVAAERAGPRQLIITAATREHQ